MGTLKYVNEQVDPVSTSFSRSFVQNPTLEVVSSVGLAGLSNVTKDLGLMVIARKKYSNTVRGVIRELGDIENANLEVIFKKIIMLIIFEVSVAFQKSWSNLTMKLITLNPGHHTHSLCISTVL